VQSAVAKIEPGLAPGERVVWAGQPKPGFRLRSADAFFIAFSIAWLDFSIFWMIMAYCLPELVGAPALSIRSKFQPMVDNG